jgi:hypothetical protein
VRNTAQVVKFHFFAFLFGLLARIAWKVLKVAGRFVIGLPLNGHRTTDSTLFSAGTKSLGEKPNYLGLQRATKWALMAGYQRAAVRIGCLVTAGVALRWPQQVAVVSVVVVGVAVGLGVWGAISRFLNRAHTRDVIEPLGAALRSRIGWSWENQPADWVEIPRDFKDKDAVMTVAVPVEYSNDQTRPVKQVVCEKLGFSDYDLEVSFYGQGAEPYLQFTHTPYPPDKVKVKHVKAAMEAALEHSPVLGLDRNEKPVSADLEADAPHILVSIPTNGGKSTFVRNVACQVLNKGAHVVLMDVKRHSHRWAKGIDSVTYLRETSEIHNALILLAEEADRRNRILDDDPNAKFQRIFIAIEEWNTTQDYLMGHWAEIKDDSKLKKSPAIAARSALLNMGRGVGINMLGVFQDASVAVVGSRSDREAFYNRVLALYTPATWKMLVPDIAQIPRVSDKKGRIQVAQRGKKPQEIQVTNFSEHEARAWALAGAASQGPSDFLSRLSGFATPGTVTAVQVEAIEAGGGELAEIEEAGPELVTLRQAADGDMRDLSDTPDKALAVLRAGRNRDKNTFPPARGKSGQDLLYSMDELRFWANNRERASVVIKREKVND